MKRLFGSIIVVGILVTGGMPAAYGEHGSSAPTCEQFAESISAVKNAQSFEVIRVAMVASGFRTPPTEELEKLFQSDLERARRSALSALEDYETDSDCK